MTQDDIRSLLTALKLGTPIRVKHEDGTEVVGNFQGTCDDRVLLEDSAVPIALDKVETVQLNVSSEGPE